MTHPDEPLEQAMDEIQEAFSVGRSWYETYVNVVRLGRQLLKQGFTADELQGYYEKPWNWTSEWNEMVSER